MGKKLKNIYFVREGVFFSFFKKKMECMLNFCISLYLRCSKQRERRKEIKEWGLGMMVILGGCVAETRNIK